MIVRKLNILTVLLGFAGFFASLYALIVHVEAIMSPGGGALCDLSATVNCTSVVTSRFGEFASIPLGAYGMAYFAIMLAAAFTPKFSQITRKQLAKLELIIAVIGLCSVVGLMFISYGILKMMCPTCSIVHAIVILYAILKIFQFVQVLKTPTYTQPADAHSVQPGHEAYVRFFAVAVCLAIPPLMVGILSPMLVNYFGKSTKQSTTVPVNEVPKQNAVVPIQNNAFMSFNKTNYVGNGEDYRRGNDNAPVIVQMFSDFGCTHCKTANAALIEAQNTVGLDKVVLVYRFYPLSNECNSFVGAKGWYKYNCSLVIAARCAGQQGKFWEFKDWAFSGQSWTNQERERNFSSTGLKAEAQSLKMDTGSFMQCLTSGVEDTKIKDDIILANTLNIQGTPLIVINGVTYSGPLDVRSFVRIFQQALKE